MWLYGQEPIKASIHPGKSGDYSYSGSGTVMALVCHLILEDHVITGPCDFTSLPSLEAISSGVVEMCLQLKDKITQGLAQICHYCLSLKQMLCHAHKHEISGRRQKHLHVCSINDSPSWSHMSTRTTDGTYLKETCQSVQKEHQE